MNRFNRIKDRLNLYIEHERLRLSENYKDLHNYTEKEKNRISASNDELNILYTIVNSDSTIPIPTIPIPIIFFFPII